MPRKKRSRGAKQPPLEAKKKDGPSPSASLRNGSERSRRKTRSQVTYTEEDDILDLQLGDREIALVENSSQVSSGSPPRKRPDGRPVRQSKRIPRGAKKRNSRAVATGKVVESDDDIQELPVFACDVSVVRTPEIPLDSSQKDDGSPGKMTDDEIIMLVVPTDEGVTDEIDPSVQSEPSYVDCHDVPNWPVVVAGTVEHLPPIYNCSDSSPNQSQVESNNAPITTPRKKVKRKIFSSASSCSISEKTGNEIEVVKISDDENEKKKSSWNVEDDLDMSVLINDTSMVFQPENQSTSGNDCTAFCDESKTDAESKDNSYADCANSVTYTIEDQLFQSSDSIKQESKESHGEQSDESDVICVSQETIESTPEKSCPVSNGSSAQDCVGANEIPLSEEQGPLKNEEQELLKSEEQERVKIEEQELLKSEDQELVKIEEQELLKSEEQELPKSEEQELLQSEEQELLNSEEQELLKSEEQELLNSEEQVLLTSEEQQLLNSKEPELLKREEEASEHPTPIPSPYSTDTKLDDLADTRSNSDTETASETEAAESKLRAFELSQAALMSSKATYGGSEEVDTSKGIALSFKSPVGVARRTSRNSSSDTQLSSSMKSNSVAKRASLKKKIVGKRITPAKNVKSPKSRRRKASATSDKEERAGIRTSSKNKNDPCVSEPAGYSKDQSTKQDSQTSMEKRIKSVGDEPKDKDDSRNIDKEYVKTPRNAKINAKSSIKKDCDEENEEISSEPEYHQYQEISRRRSSSSSVRGTKTSGTDNTPVRKKAKRPGKLGRPRIIRYEGITMENGETPKEPLKRKKVGEGSSERGGGSPEKSLPFNYNKKWIYNSEHRNFLYGDKMFVAYRHDLNLTGNIHLWRIRSKQKMLQKFVPVEIDGRDCHCGVDSYKSFTFANDDLYVKYQPVIVDMLIDTDERQVGMYYSMNKSFPVLGYFPLTQPLFAQFKEFLKHMTIRAMTDTSQLKPTKTFKSEDCGGVSAAVDHIENYITSVLEGIMIRPHWPQTTMICLLEYPNFSLTKAGVEKDGNCAACVQKGRSGVGAYKIYFYGNCYDADTLILTNKEGPQVPDNQFCYACPITLKAVHRLVHYKYWVFIAIRMQLQQLYSRLKPETKYSALDVFNFIMGDFQWIKHMFYEFQTITGEGIQAKEKADRQDRALEKKEKAAVATTVRNSGKKKGNGSPTKTGTKHIKDSKSLNSQSAARRLSGDSKRKSKEHSFSDQRQIKKNLKIPHHSNGNSSQSILSRSEVSTDHRTQQNESLPADS